MSFDVTNLCHDFESAWWNGVVLKNLAGRNVVATGAEKDIDWRGKDPGEVALGHLSKVVKGKLKILSTVGRQKYSGRVIKTELAVTVGPHLFVIDCGKKSISVDVFSKDFAKAAEIVPKFIKLFPKLPRRTEPSVVPMTFWHYDERAGAESFEKDIDCPAFETIAENYTASARGAFEHLTSLDRPDERGKIVLWHGPPGTGKTYAVRALSRAWFNKFRASVEVVLDPETLFSKVSYMNSVLLSDAPRRRGVEACDDEFDGGGSSKVMKDEPTQENTLPIRLVILEDSTELFIAERRNQSFSRFLNLTDGLVGQGLRTIFLLTSNEPLNKIDPAVRRAGRCLQSAEFGPLSQDEAYAWLDSRELPAETMGDAKFITLADLYSKVTGKASLLEPIGAEAKADVAAEKARL